MMGWFRRMFSPQRTHEAETSRPAPSKELAAARARHRQLLSRADAAIKDAMEHADEMFVDVAPYRGPERRRSHR